jgi:hypothetical protein
LFANAQESLANTFISAATTQNHFHASQALVASIVAFNANIFV